jgi:hypothetical protein
MTRQTQMMTSHGKLKVKEASKTSSSNTVAIMMLYIILGVLSRSNGLPTSLKCLSYNGMIQLYSPSSTSCYQPSDHTFQLLNPKLFIYL